MVTQTPAVSLACPVQPGRSAIPVLVAPLAQGMWLLGPMASRSVRLLLCWPRACQPLCQPEAGPGCSVGPAGQVVLLASAGGSVDPGQVNLPSRASSFVIPGQIALLLWLGWATEVPALG